MLCMFMCHEQNAGGKHKMKAVYESVDDVVKLRYLQMTLKIQNCTHSFLILSYERSIFSSKMFSTQCDLALTL